jgi:hypothetical protein
MEQPPRLVEMQLPQRVMHGYRYYRPPNEKKQEVSLNGPEIFLVPLMPFLVKPLAGIESVTEMGMPVSSLRSIPGRRIVHLPIRIF